MKSLKELFIFYNFIQKKEKNYLLVKNSFFILLYNVVIISILIN